MSHMNEIQKPQERDPNDRRRRTTLSEVNSINERRNVNDYNRGPKTKTQDQ